MSERQVQSTAVLRTVGRTSLQPASSRAATRAVFGTMAFACCLKSWMWCACHVQKSWSTECSGYSRAVAFACGLKEVDQWWNSGTATSRSCRMPSAPSACASSICSSWKEISQLRPFRSLCKQRWQRIASVPLCGRSGAALGAAATASVQSSRRMSRAFSCSAAAGCSPYNDTKRGNRFSNGPAWLTSTVRRTPRNSALPESNNVAEALAWSPSRPAAAAASASSAASTWAAVPLQLTATVTRWLA
mmetsp:Transcript_67868/g.219330  ORF Transcript_67868/g.219330 Transcript_67868/m.219330 type:complete len:246 (-) Transcript_67868:1502-2239(-)